MKLLLLCVSLVILVGSSPAYGDQIICLDGVTTTVTEDELLNLRYVTLGECEEEQLPEFDMESAVVREEREPSWVDDVINDTNTKQLEYENQILKIKIIELEKRVDSLHAIVMEQLGVILRMWSQ